MAFAKGPDSRRGKGGRRPGSGRKPLATRALCQLTFHKRIPRLAKIADEGKDRDAIAAMKVLGSIGMPAQTEVSGPEGRPVEIRILGMDKPNNATDGIGD